jgi:hypothetical protein
MVVATKRSPPDTGSALRLQLDPHPSRTTALDGGWWPHSTDSAAELPALLDALAGVRGDVTHALMNTAEWDLPHLREIPAAGRSVHLGWYTSQPAGLLTVICDFGNDRFDLLVVPSDATASSAAAVLGAAADGADGRRTPELLTEVEHRD